MPKSDGYVSAYYLRKAAEMVQHLKQRSYEHMSLQAGHQALDVGCGPGMDTVPLAKIVGRSGQVVGVDIDEEMLAQADVYADQEDVADTVRHQMADVRHLPFADAEFDACRAERLLQVLPANYEPKAVVTELQRVLRSGGRLVLVDTDWATASVDYSDSELERRLMTFFARSMRPNGFAGRQAFGLMHELGFADIQVETIPMVHADYQQTPFGDWLRDEAIKANIAAEEEMDNWQRELEQRQQKGNFYASVNMVLVSGVKA